jgi:glycosyl transferase family 87
VARDTFRDAIPRTILDSAARMAFTLIALGGIALTALVWPPLGPGELGGEWNLARGLLGGAGAGFYAIGRANAYPLPYELLFVPIGLLNAPAVSIVGRLATLVLIGAGLGLWCRNQRWGLAAALLSLPAAEAVMSDHLMSAVGLFALSLAVWAHRHNRWALAGAALGLGGIRFANALPLVLILFLSGERTWSRIGKMVVGGMAVVVPLTVAAFALDPSWPNDYLRNLAVYGMAGLSQFASLRWGWLGEAGLVVGIAVGGAAIARGRGQDGLSMALAASVLAAPMQGPYAAIFALPALVRLAERRASSNASFLASGALWAAFAAAVQFRVVPLMSGAGLWLLISAYPLLRRTEQADSDVELQEANLPTGVKQLGERR